MAFLDTQPAPMDDASGLDPFAAFRLESPREIAALMRQLMDGSTPVNLSSPEGTSLSTALWTVDSASQRLAFQADGDSPQLQRLIESNEVTAVSYLEAVKLQFDLHHLMLVRGAKTCALQAAMPRRVYRFQRRQAYRVRTLERSAPVALLRHPALPDIQLSLRVLDVSIGGCALLMPDDMPPLQPGLTLHAVRMELDPDTRLSTTLHVHHISSIHPNARGVRLGCELVKLDAAAERALQRYIDQTQKRRRLLSLG
ncbi:flagellar brake protein [Aquabacterium sp.]|uniref:flagellar brake protein n=1 Tax=Aquabacterium sp. TaxID=1872578 RepID=UPI002C0CF6AE|nr:flagellar brake protein [Aquabacterium sp.]HSW04642.1 flagellar brake protein [Aquabacterium sp.]